MVAAAIIGGAVVGAAGTAIAGHQSSSATRDASNAAVQQQQQAVSQQAQLSQPYRDLGTSAIPTLQNLLGINGADPTASLRNTPGYQFTLNEGLNATKNAATASGLALSGNTLEALDRYSTGLADQTYQQQIGNFENVVGLGQAAAAGQAANIGNAAANTSNILTNQGNTLAAIQANQIAGITKSIGNGVNNYATLSAMGDGSAGGGWWGGMNQGVSGIPFDSGGG